MKRDIIEIDENKCIGCSLCINACMQDALKLINGKAVLVNDSYCDGLGMCLPQCPVDAITITNKDAEVFDKKQLNAKLKLHDNVSALRQWPVQLHLVRENAPFFENSNLLIAADCVPFANANFHAEMLQGKSLVMACPKLDDTSQYIEKLANIFEKNNIKTITLAIMEVPCCGGLRRITEAALAKTSKEIVVREIIVKTNGEIA